MNHKDLEYRRDRIVSLYSEGRNHSQIAKILHISRPTVTRDLHYCMKQTKEKAQTFLEEKLPFEGEACRVGLNKVLEKVWDIIQDKQTSEKAILQALALAKDCYISRMHLLESQSDIHREIEVVSQYKEEQERISRLESDRYQRELMEPTDYALSNAKF
jgi:predicted XRE-type DNA-binding protein